MNCPHCGAELPEEVKFCSDCGAALPIESAATVPLPGSSSHSSTRPWFVILGIVVVGVVFIIVLMRGVSGSLKAFTFPLTGTPSETAPTYHDSNEILDPYDLSKNTYKWKGHSGILDTIHVPLIMSNGTRVGQVAYPGGCLKFNKMLDEHTAIYEVMVGREDVHPEGEIAVILPDSDPPDSRRPWRVFVEGPMEAVNGLGATIEIGAVRFEGYYVPQPKPVVAPPEPQPSPLVGGLDGQSVPLLTQQAESGDATAQRKLGYAYLDGEGVPKNESEAARWSRKAAEQGDAKAQHNLGLMYDKGRGVPKDEAEAVRWFRKAAEQGLADAQSNLGTLYYEGRGVPRNYEQAAVWYRKAAEQGEPMAQYFLGLSYFDGDGVPKDDAEAVRWFRKAAEQGDTGAQSSLGLMYAANRGVPKDNAEAYFWLSLGATSAVTNNELFAGKGITRATLRDQVSEHLTPANRLKIQERLRKWEETHPQKHE